jgi:HAE1 family hydrophobic/amphiphilic exporter-1
VDFFIHKPVFATVCSLFVVISGAVVIPLLPVAQFPQLTQDTDIAHGGFVRLSSRIDLAFAARIVRCAMR